MNDTVLHPFISILIPMYNLGSGVKRCLLSALAQTYKDYDVIAIDDGSTDGTFDAAMEVRRDGHTRLHVGRIPHGGAAAARNELLKEADGDYIFWLDADDVLDPCTLEKCVSLLSDTVKGVRIDFTRNSQDIKIYSKEAYSNLVLTDYLKSFLTGSLFPKAWYTEQFLNGCLIEDYEYYPKLLKNIDSDICVYETEHYYHYTVMRAGSTTALTALKPAGILARMKFAEERYAMVRTDRPDAAEIILSQLTDYAVTGAISRDRPLHQQSIRILRSHEYEIANCKDVPGFRKKEVRMILHTRYGSRFLRHTHAVKQRFFGRRHNDRRF